MGCFGQCTAGGESGSVGIMGQGPHTNHAQFVISVADQHLVTLRFYRLPGAKPGVNIRGGRPDASLELGFGTLGGRGKIPYNRDDMVSRWRNSQSTGFSTLRHQITGNKSTPK